MVRSKKQHPESMYGRTKDAARALRAIPTDNWSLNPSGSEPLYIQLGRSIKRQISSGAIKSGSILPSTRKLSQQLNVSRSTVVAAYELLMSEGMLESRPGSTTVVKAPFVGAHKSSRTPPTATLAAPSILCPRIAPVGHMHDITWKKIFHQDGIVAPQDCEVRLRENLASYLALSRGMNCTAENILVLTSVQQGLNLIARFAKEHGVVFSFEPWSSERARATFTILGAGVSTLPALAADLSKADFSNLSGQGIFLTPSHHYPLSRTMLLESRSSLVDEADDNSLWVVEDARDLEFLNTRGLPTIYGLRSGHQTFHIGTMSAVLAPYVQLAYIVATEEIVSELSSNRFLFDDIPPTAMEIASELLETGMFHAATRAARQVAVRRCALFYGAASRFDFWELPKPENRQGLHGIIWIAPQGNDILALRSELRALDPQIEIVTEEFGVRIKVGLVVGFAATPDQLIEGQVVALANALRRWVRRSEAD